MVDTYDRFHAVNVSPDLLLSVTFGNQRKSGFKLVLVHPVFPFPTTEQGDVGGARL